MDSLNKEVEFTIISDKSTIKEFISLFEKKLTHCEIVFENEENYTKVHSGVDPASIVSAIAASGALILEIVRFIYERLEKKKTNKIELKTWREQVEILRSANVDEKYITDILLKILK